MLQMERFRQVGPVAACLLGFSGGAAADEQARVDISLEGSQHAQVVQLSYYVDEWQGEDRLHFEVELKNIDDDPRRFRVRIVTEDGTANGMLYPRSGGDEPVIEPGASHAEVIPTLATQIPAQFSVSVEDF